jgi:DNA-directed RNA polymerase sigma subunit (sigma70/sigma32)
MPDDNWMTLNDWRADAIHDVRLAHERVRKANEEGRQARAELRDRALVARRLGLTLEQIGQAMGVSRQRVHEMTR